MSQETNLIPEAVLNDLFERGEHLYETTLQPVLEPEQNGCFVALHVDSSEYEVARSASEAIRAFLSCHPVDGRLHIRKIGSEPELGFAARLSGASTLSRGAK